jgi:predicted DNA-binding transcriptional regulator AlpA
MWVFATNHGVNTMTASPGFRQLKLTADEKPASRTNQQGTYWPVDPGRTGLTRAQAAQRLGIRVETLCRMNSRGEGPMPMKLGARLIRYDPDIIDSWLRGERNGEGGGVYAPQRLRSIIGEESSTPL